MSMTAIMAAEWRRFIARPVSRWILLALGLLLLASAVWAGLGARSYRAETVSLHLQWRQVFDQAVAGAPQDFATDRPTGSEAASTAHAIGRGELAPTRLPATGALVLGLQQYQVLPTAVRATVESRYTDGRVTGSLVNPWLSQTGLPSFPAIIVLLVPLAALALTAGMVQEEREQGIWRLICAQCSVGLGRVYAAAMAVRWAAVFAVAALCSVGAFVLDPGAALAPLFAWLLALAVFTAFWVLAGGALSLLPVSAGAALTGALGLWLALTFAVPAGLAWMAERVAPMPSRLSAIVELRAVQQDAEEREAELLKAWYADHPEQRPAPGMAPVRPTRPVTFMPRFEEQERHMRPLMRAFDKARSAQAARVEGGAWLSPSLALMVLADRLAGIDAERYGRYMEAVDRFEDRWRAFFMPGIMSYRGVTASQLRQLPVFEQESAHIDHVPSEGPALWWLLAACLSVAALLAVGRRALVRP
ncbi:DUF3526 domain-containing protein [Pseudomonas helleri]|uniref:DUF3526 domain-containing protein n=4 Tax=Bacteria TaxID=2 RepID=A0A7X1XHG9_9PSED|nr:DUF3526 domain-containing protein [Pseudomonas helleri]MQT91635.1 DUF3526 domain-containing protein [Pseudomonas helleri]